LVGLAFDFLVDLQVRVALLLLDFVKLALVLVLLGDGSDFEEVGLQVWVRMHCFGVRVVLFVLPEQGSFELHVPLRDLANGHVGPHEAHVHVGVRIFEHFLKLLTLVFKGE